MRIEKETEVTIKIRIGFVWPDDFQDKYHMSEDSFRNTDMIPDTETARELIMVLWEKSSDLVQAAEVTVRDLGVVQE